MAVAHMVRLQIFVVILAFIQITLCLQVKKFPLRMPNVHPDRDELYLCTPVKVVANESFYIVGFEPLASMSVVHHMLVFGCTTPGQSDPLWDCGEMASSFSMSSGPQLKRANPCDEGSHVIYAWARNAKSFQLPKDVGFQVGQGTAIKYIVLQVHYSKKFPETKLDSSGLNLIYTKEPQRKLAGVLLLGVGGSIPGHSITKMEAACQITEPNKVIYPFAYRVHTHTIGRVVAGYNVRRDFSGMDHWTLLGKRDPLTPQMFYKVFDYTPIRTGDTVASRCTMNSMNRERTTNVGSTNNDEMCNFYLMYYIENGTPLEMKYCTGVGPPNYWNNTYGLNHIPDRDASTLDY